MSVALNFSTQGVSLEDQISIFPEGWYKVAVTSSEILKLNDNASHALKLNCAIIEPQAHAGQTYSWLLNLYHVSSEQAVAAAKRDLARICMVIGKPQGVQASGELHGIPFAIHLKVTERKPVRQNDGSEKVQQPINNVDSIRDLQGRAPKEIAGGQPPGSAAPGTAPPAAPGGPPAGYAQPGFTPAPMAGAPPAAGPGAGQPPAQTNPAPQPGAWQPPAGGPSPAPGSAPQGFVVDKAPPPNGPVAQPGPSWPGAANQPTLQPGAAPAPGGPAQHAPWAGPGQ